MKNLLLLTFLLIGRIMCFGQSTPTIQNSSFTSKETNAVFEENKGQMKDQYWQPRPDVLYYGQSEGMNYYIRNTGMSYQLSRIESWKEEDELFRPDKEKRKVPNEIGTYRVDADWVNANSDFSVLKGKELDGYNNYYNVPEGVEPALFVKKFEALTLKNIWEGIDIHYYGTNGFLETDYIIAPGANYHQIQLDIKGAELSLSDNGTLIMKTPFGEIHEGELKVYQNGERIEAYWKIDEHNRVSFEIPNYNPEVAMTIDPLTRVWGTYYGGSGYDSSYSVTKDTSGNIYLVGQTESNMGIASGGHQNTYVAGDAFAVKFNEAGIREWGTYYGYTGGDIGYSAATDVSGNIYMAGMTSSGYFIAFNGHQNTQGGSVNAFLVKFNSSGIRQWGTYYGGAGLTYGMSTTTDLFGNVYLAGRTDANSSISSGGHQNSYGGGFNDAFLVKFDSNGNRQWGTYYGGSNPDYGNSVSTDNSGNIYLAGETYSTNAIAFNGHQSTYESFSDGDAFLVKFNNDGVRQWGTYYGGPNYDGARCVITDGQENIYLGGVTESIDSIAFDGHQNLLASTNADGFLVKFDSFGIRQWGTYYGGLSVDKCSAIATDSNGDVYITGETSSISAITIGDIDETFGGWSDAFIAKFDSNGARKWGTYYGDSLYDVGNSITTDNYGNVYLAGETASIFSIAQNGHQNISGGGEDSFLVKFKQPKITGFVWLDSNEDCVTNPIELPYLINGINIMIQPGNTITQVVDNSWAVDSLAAGTYSVTIDTTNLNWDLTCPITQYFTVSNSNGLTNGPNFGLISTIPCTDPDVSIFAPSLRRCFPNRMIYVQACNQATATGILNASYVDIELDPLITVTASSMPYAAQGNNTYRFQIGNLTPGECVNFNLSTTISCNAFLFQTLCMDATLYPIESCALDTVPSDPPSVGGGGTGGTLNGLPQPCTLPWDQSSLSVDGWCANDSIYFTITNTGVPGGGDMECYSPLWITVDGVVTYTDSIMIPGGQTITLSFPGDGQTWILNASQHPLHPGNSNPNAHVEACGDTLNWTPDQVNDFPLDDADPVVDIYCGAVTGSYDPNDKTGYPTGVTEQNYIQPNQQLQYVIRFQNTGTDTAFTVVIRDTLDTDLNIFTVTPGVSSHNYDFRMYGPRILEWTFNNINLPDSTTNQEGSNGFVTFHVEQVPDLAPGTEITNDADIYFDFNAPITTNTTMHRIYEGFVAVADLEEMSKETSGLSVYPNPSNGAFTLVMDKETGAGNYSLYDQQGRIVKTGLLTGKKTTIDLDLNGGVYYLMVGSRVAKVQVVR